MATPMLVLLTNLLTTGAGRGLGTSERPLPRGQFPQPLSVAFTLHSVVSQLHGNSSAALYFGVFSYFTQSLSHLQIGNFS